MPEMIGFGAMMVVIILASIAVPVAIVGGVIFFFVRSQGRRTRLQSSGILARATITSVSDTGMTINDNPRARFELLVEPSSGTAFNAIAIQVVSRLAIPRVGDVVAVRYDPSNSQDVMISLAEAPPSVGST